MARPRRTLEQRLELARLNEARAAERLARKTRKVQKYESVQKARDRKLDTRRKIIAGALALEHMRHDPEWGVVFRELLDQYVVKEPERLLFGLPPLPPEEGGGSGKKSGKRTSQGAGGARPGSQATAPVMPEAAQALVPAAAPAIAPSPDLKTLAGPAAASVRSGGRPIAGAQGYLTPAPRPTDTFLRLHGRK